jgi:DNA polymerase alpha subunit B
VLEQIRSSECVGGRAKVDNIFERACRGVIQQRHFMPVFPPADRVALDEAKPAVKDEADGETQEEMEWKSMGAALDVSYLKLGEWLNVRPDVLITPSVLTPFAKASRQLSLDPWYFC